MQLNKFPHPHLVACGWYLDCSCGFVPEAEESLYNTLVSSGPEVIELEEEREEEDNLALPTNVKEFGSAKGKGKGKTVASTQVSTRSYSKASVLRTPTSATIVVDSRTTTPYSLFLQLQIGRPWTQNVGLCKVPIEHDISCM